MEAPEYNFQSSFCSQYTAAIEKHHSSDNNKTGTAGSDHFMVEDLLDFSNDDAVNADGMATFDTVTGNSTDSSTVSTIVNDTSCNSSSFSGSEPGLGDIGCRNLADGGHFSNDLCVPYDDLAELEWVSNFEEESFSSEDLQKLQIISGMKTRSEEPTEFQPEPNGNSSPAFHSADMLVPAKARSKRTRTAPCNWTSRLLVLSMTTSSSDTKVNVVPPPLAKKTIKQTAKKKELKGSDGMSSGSAGDGRKCLHCSTDKTPQWRTGPMGPKTLCNACGVRYKSGRLVPEYRPAASPTFVLTKHSNSHRKVMELRRQKEMTRADQQQQQVHQHLQFVNHHHNMVFDVSNGDDYLIHQQMGPDFRQLI